MKQKNIITKKKSGQALTTLLIIMFVGLSVITSAVGLANINLTSTSGLLEANQALIIAENGAEDTLLKILRNPSYISGTLPSSDGLATISVASTSPFIFVSRGNVGQHQRSIQVTINTNDGIMTVSSWKEK